MSKTESTEDFAGFSVRRGLSGTSQIGYKWTERFPLETSDASVQVETDTHGLPGIEIVWTFRLRYAGQLGHCAFRHGRLEVRFATEDAKARFEESWAAVFGVALELEAASGSQQR